MAVRESTRWHWSEFETQQAFVIRIIRVLSDMGPSSLFFSVIWPSIVKSLIIKSSIM